MTPIELALRSENSPPADAPVDGELSSDEIDGNFTALKTAAEELNEEKVGWNDAEPIDTELTELEPTDKVVVFRDNVGYDAQLQALLNLSGGGVPVVLSHNGGGANPVVGDTLTANFAPGWTGPIQWRRNGTNIVGATSATYLTVPDDGGTTVSAAIGDVDGMRFIAAGLAVASGSATAPAAFGGSDWFVSPGVEEYYLDIDALPSDGGSAITAIEARENGGAPFALTGVGLGVRTLTGKTGGVLLAVDIRAVNAVGNGPWSSPSKNVTPTASGGGGVLTISQNTGADLSLGESVCIRNGGSAWPGVWEPGIASDRMLWRPGTGFNTTNIPGVINAATLRLYQRDNGGVASVTAYNNLRAWAVWGGGPSWDEYANGGAWQVPGGSGALDRSSSNIGTEATPAVDGVWIEIELDAAAVEAWRQAGGAGANGVQLDGAGVYSTYVTDVGDDGQRPELIVTYS